MVGTGGLVDGLKRKRSMMEMIMNGGGGVEEKGGCSTPERWECRIPKGLVPPPPPKKKPFSMGKKREAPKNGYFQPPDLEELFFARRQACA